MKPKMLFEIYHSVQKVEEILDEKGTKKYIISGIYTKANSPNGNNNIYPGQILQEAINKFREKVKQGKVKMAMDHPDFCKGGQLKETAAIMTELSDLDEQGYAKYKAQIINKGCGEILRSIVDAGGTVGVSTRGEGFTLPEQEWPGLPGKYNIIQSGYKLKNVDFVDEPSVSESEDTMQLENMKRSKDMTIEQLKKDFPELFKIYDATFEEKIASLTKLLEDEKAKIIHTESYSSKLVTTIKEMHPELFVTIPESDVIKTKNEEVENITKKLTESEIKLVETNKKISILESEKIKLEKEKKIEELKAKNPEYFTSFEFFAKKFECCVNAEEVVKVFESNKELIDNVKSDLAKKFTPAPSKSENSEKKTEALTEAQKQHLNVMNSQRLAVGMNSWTEEDYLKINK